MSSLKYGTEIKIPTDQWAIMSIAHKERIQRDLVGKLLSEIEIEDLSTIFDFELYEDSVRREINVKAHFDIGKLADYREFKSARPIIVKTPIGPRTTDKFKVTFEE